MSNGRVFHLNVTTRSLCFVLGLGAILFSAWGWLFVDSLKLTGATRIAAYCGLAACPLIGLGFIWHGITSRMVILDDGFVFYMPGSRKVVNFKDVGHWRIAKRSAPDADAALEVTYLIAEFYGRDSKLLARISLEIERSQTVVDLLSAKLKPPSRI